MSDWEQVFVRSVELARAGDLAGRAEFDWFGRDIDGALAVFISASYGNVPLGAVPSNVRYIAAMKGVFVAESMDWRDPNSEPTYARAGLYVYEWRRAAPGDRSLYVRVLAPSGPLAPAVVAAVFEASAAMLVRFAEAPEVRVSP